MCAKFRTFCFCRWNARRAQHKRTHILDIFTWRRACVGQSEHSSVASASWPGVFSCSGTERVRFYSYELRFSSSAASTHFDLFFSPQPPHNSSMYIPRCTLLFLGSKSSIIFTRLLLCRFFLPGGSRCSVMALNWFQLRPDDGCFPGLFSLFSFWNRSDVFQIPVPCH